jgi:hypothetical protein
MLSLRVLQVTVAGVLQRTGRDVDTNVTAYADSSVNYNRTAHQNLD